MNKLIDRFRNIAMVIGLMLTSASFILLGSDNGNQSIVNLGASAFFIFSVLFIIELVLMSLGRD
jgi:hypothetical protein